MNTEISNQKQPKVVSEIADLRQAIATLRKSGKRIGLVPTMGALHDGHLSLVRRSNESCDATVVTIFVNPTQFGPNEDLDAYPRTLDSDLTALGRHEVDVVFAPSVSQLYPSGFTTFVSPPAVAERLEGECRPDHFRGVTTIVLKLFNLAQSDIAFFGQKDYQQAAVIKAMVRDLDVPIEIEVCPIVREADGLALSSRNRYLDETEREQALALSRSLKKAESMVGQGTRDVDTIRNAMKDEFELHNVKDVEYVEIVDPDTLVPIDRIHGEAVALVAARVGTTRLIDNQVLVPKD